MVARLLAIAIAVCSVRTAYAEEKPWGVNVSPEEQKAALALYKDANDAFEQSDYKTALPKYIEALKHWDHPSIHYNAGICLFNLDRPVEAQEQLVAALRYGAAPFSGELYTQAKNYMKLLEGRVATLEVSCEDDAAVVFLDGQLLFIAPGKVSKNVTAGQHHQVVTTKDHFVTDRQDFTLDGREHRPIKVTLKPVVVQRRLQRRWAKWKPYGVMVAGGVIALGGIPWLFAARDHRDKYDYAVSQICPTGCPDDNPDLMREVMNQKGPFDRDNNYAIATFAIGGAVVVGGFVMALLNQPRLGPAITPTVGSDHVGLVISGRL